MSDLRRRRGTVFIAWEDFDPEPGRYFGYWDGGGHGPDDGFLEQMPESASLDAVLAWARERSDRVRIRPSWDAARYYSAGAERVPALPELTLPD